MAPRRRVVRLGIPGLIVAGLAVVALWRIGLPHGDRGAVGSTGTAAANPEPAPLTTLVEIIAKNAVGREASLEGVEIREMKGDRSFWVGSTTDRPVFAVLGAGATRDPAVTLTPGQRVTLVGRVRPAPASAEAIDLWKIDAPTAKAIEELGTYLEVTEVRN